MRLKNSFSSSPSQKGKKKKIFNILFKKYLYQSFQFEQQRNIFALLVESHLP